MLRTPLNLPLSGGTSARYFRTLGMMKYVFIFCLFFIPFDVSAMIVSPVMYDVQIDRGSQVDRVIELKNDTKQTVTYGLSSENFISSGEEGGQMYLTSSSQKDLASWMSWPSSSIVVEAGDTVKVPITIRVPNDAEPGGHYATVFFSQGGNGDSGVGMMQQVGVLFLLRVSGELTERAYIESFELRASSDVANHLPLVFDVRVRNQGSVHIRPEGEIVITNALGKTVSRIPFNPKNGAVLPNGVRHFETSWGEVNALNQQKGFWSELKTEWKQMAVGRYVAEIHATYGSMSQEFPKLKEVFWVLPWHLGLVALIGVIAFLILIKVYNHCLICSRISKSDAEKTKRKTTRR